MTSPSPFLDSSESFSSSKEESESKSSAEDESSFEAAKDSFTLPMLDLPGSF